MRIILTLAVAAAALAACQSEEQLKERYKTEVVSSCTSRMNQQGGGATGLDVARFCSCLAERSMAGRSVQDLQNLNSAAGAAAGQEAAAQCLSEQGGAAPAGNQSGGNVAQEVQNTGAEAAQEATENTE